MASHKCTTHYFAPNDEAKQCATRHVALKDGAKHDKVIDFNTYVTIYMDLKVDYVKEHYGLFYRACYEKVYCTNCWRRKRASMIYGYITDI